VIGALLPWSTVTAPFIGTAYVFGFEGDGLITGGIGLLLLIIFILSKGTPGKLYSVIGAIVGCSMALILAFDMKSAFSTIYASQGPVRASIGPGPFLSMIGAILIVVGGFLRVPRLSQPLIQKKSTNWLGVLLAVSLGLFGTFWCLLQLGGVLSSLSNYSAPTTYRVTYKVTGTATGASVTYENPQGGTEQDDYVSIPWEKSFTFGRGDFVYLSAQNDSEYGSVACEIWVNEVKWKTSTSRGAYSIASCSGLVGRE
jgi:hypothetical protein